jgi:integrase
MNLKLIDGKWTVDIEVRGKRLRRAYQTKSEAQNALALLRSQRAMSRLGIEVPEAKSHDLLFKDFAEKVIAGKAEGDLRASTKRATRYCLNALLASEIFDGKRLAEITTENIADYRSARGNEKAAANAGLGLLKMIFRRAVEWGELSRNTADPVEYFRIPATKLRILTDAEVALLLHAASPVLAPLLRVLLTTGMRPHEAFALRWEYDGWDVEEDLDKSIVALDRKSIFIPGLLSKNHKDREVPLSPELVEMFKGLRHDSTSDKVFPWINCPDAFSEAVRAAGLKNVTLYTLKHTAASRMIRAGVDIVTVSEILGHSDIKMTMIYCHSDGQSKREAVERVSRIYFQAPKVADAPAAAAVQPEPKHAEAVN